MVTGRLELNKAKPRLETLSARECFLGTKNSDTIESPVARESQEIFEQELAANILSSLDVNTYLTCAANHVQHLPNALDGAGSTRLFEFMRLAKAHPELMRLSAHGVLPTIERWLGYYSVPVGV